MSRPFFVVTVVLARRLARPADADVVADLRGTRVVAAREGDAALAAAFFSERAAILPPGFPSFTGRKAVENFYRDGFAVASVSSFKIHPKATSANTALQNFLGAQR